MVGISAATPLLDVRLRDDRAPAREQLRRAAFNVLGQWRWAWSRCGPVRPRRGSCVTLRRDGSFSASSSASRTAGRPAALRGIVQEARKRGLAGARCSRLRGVRAHSRHRRASCGCRRLRSSWRSWTRKRRSGVPARPRRDDEGRPGHRREGHRHLLTSGRTAAEGLEQRASDSFASERWGGARMRAGVLSSACTPRPDD